MNKSSFFLFSMMAIISGCGSFKDYTPPQTSSYDNNNKALDTKLSVRLDANEPVKKWWEKLNDPQLNQLIILAQEKNYDIKIAKESLKASRIAVDQADYAQLPIITSSASGNKQLLSVQNNFGFAPQDRKVGLYNAGFDAVWEADFFGRISETIKQAQANSDAYQAMVYASSLAVTSEIVRNYVVLRGTQQRLKVAHEIIENSQKTLNLANLLVDSGEGDMLGVEQAKTQLELFRVAVPSLQAQIQIALNRLSVLTGQNIGTLNSQLEKPTPLPTIPYRIGIGEIPSLLQRRPDIFKAERELAASVASYNIQVADLYPRVRLIGSLGFSATHLDDIGTSGTSRYLIGPSLEWAAFDIGRVRTRIKIADAETKIKLAQFEKTILMAFEGVNNALQNFAKAEKEQSQLRQAFQSSSKATYYADLRLRAGVENMLDYLQVEKTMLSTQDQIAQADMNVMLELISVYKELGGGWESDADELEK